jgi:superfamily II DNA/RNA helicase
VINYLVPHSQEIWLQRVGRTGRKKGSRSCIIIMATKKMIKDAASMCQEAGIDVSAELLAIKVKDEVS